MKVRIKSYVFLLLIFTLSCRPVVNNSQRNLFNKIDLRQDTGSCHFKNISERNIVDGRGIIRVYCELNSPDGNMNGFWLRSKDTLYFSDGQHLIPMLIFSIKSGDSVCPTPVGMISMERYYIKADTVYTYRNDTVFEITHGFIPFMPDDDEWNDEKGFIYKPDEARNNFIKYKISLRKGVLSFKKIKSKIKPAALPYE